MKTSRISQPKNKYLSIRFTQNEYQRLKEEAAKQDRSIAYFVRKALFHVMGWKEK